MDQPSPFLRLPFEVRRQIFELLPVHTKYLSIWRGDSTSSAWKGKSVVVLPLHYVERNIQQTCRQLVEEAEPILEIETMKLGPPSVIAVATYLPQVSRLLDCVCATQNDTLFRRLRITDKDRRQLSLQGQRILMWIRIANLNLLSEPRFSIGLYLDPVPNYSLELLRAWVSDCLGKFRQHIWWNNGIMHKQPQYKVLIEHAMCHHCNGFHGSWLDTGFRRCFGVPEFFQWYFGVASFRDVLK